MILLEKTGKKPKSSQFRGEKNQRLPTDETVALYSRDAQTTRLAQSGLHPFSLYAAFFRARLLIHSNLRIDVWPYSLLRKSSFCPYCNVWDI